VEHPNKSLEQSNNFAVSAKDPRHKLASAFPIDAQSFRFVGQSGKDDGDATGLLTYWRIINRRKGTLALCIVIGIVLGYACGLPMIPVYQARAALEVLSLNEDFLNMKQSSPVTTADYSYETSELQTQIRLIKSDSLINAVLDKLDAQSRMGGGPAKLPNSIWRKFFRLPDPNALPRGKLISQAVDSLKVSATPRTRIIELTSNSVDPQFAADFVNTLATEYIQHNLRARWETNQKTSEWLRGELEQARSKLERSENALQTYARDSGLIFTSSETNISSEKLQQVQQELSAATADRISKQSRYELAQQASPNTLPDVLNDPGLRNTADRITELQRQIASLSSTYTPEFNKVKRAEAELATLQTSFNNDRKDILARIKNEYTEALRKEKLLRDAYDIQTREVTGQGTKSIQYNLLKREVDSNRQIYDTMLQQLKQSTIASAVRASNARIVDAAKASDLPISPNFKANSIMGLIAGLLAGLVIVMTSELGNRTLQQPGDAKFWTSLPELGTIPSASLAGDRRLGKPRPSVGGVIDIESPQKKKPAGLNRGKNTVGGLMKRKPQPRLVAEAFRSVLTSILFAGDNVSEYHILGVTSANPSEGKTTVVTNLGIAMAEIGRSVLIIDADLRRPRIHSVFGVPNHKGLGGLLKQNPLPETELDGLIQETRVPGLYVLPSGPPTDEAANLLYSPNLRAILGKLQKEFDMILVDTPPMLELPDARLVGRAVDAMILVARAQQTTKDALVAVYQRLSDDRIRMLGTVLNDWNPKKSIKGYYGYGAGTYFKDQSRYTVGNAS
jgi:polysaccharide biosynthesis transport protein